MHQLHLGKIRQGNGTLRQDAEPVEIFRRQFVSGPNGGGRSHGVEVIEVQKSGNGFVVIAPHEDFPQVTGAGGYFIRTGPVADNVSEIHDSVKRWDGSEAGFERFEIGVNVAQQQYAHESPDKLPIID